MWHRDKFALQADQEGVRYRDFDIMAFLDDRQVRYWTGGRNVSNGWIGLRCVFPGCPDRSNHLGINLTYNNYSCWKCGNFGQVLDIIMEVDQCQKAYAYKTLRSFRKDPRGIQATHPSSPSDVFPLGQAEQGILPKGSKKEFPIAHLRYLRGRGFKPRILIPEYDLYAIDYQHPKYPNKIIAPIYVEGSVVSWIAADILRQFSARTKYRICPDPQAMIPGDQLIYNFDSIGPKHKALIVEGITDVWTIGPGTIATLRTTFTKPQLELISRKQLSEAYVLYDPDAEDKANQLSLQLSAIVDNVFFVPIKGGDPAELKYGDIVRLRKYLK